MSGRRHQLHRLTGPQTNQKMIRPAHIATLLCACFTAPVMAQQFDVSDAALAARFSINGVRISSGNKVALVNDQLFRVGEYVDDAEVIAIESNAVHLRVANRAFAMRVGSALIRESHHASEHIADTPEALTETPDVAIAESSTEPPFEPDLPDFAPTGDFYGPVAPGETLSGIASVLTDDASEADSIMHALYASNPQAFGDSMDLLFAGARLRIPAGAGRVAPLERLAAAPAPRGPPDPGAVRAGRILTVQPGDTLSKIAESLAIQDITLNQAMLAIFAANPDSFGGNLNLLYAGETLEIPSDEALRQHDVHAASAEVARHAANWQAQVSRFNST
jgi:FimV-like protein